VLWVGLFVSAVIHTVAMDVAGRWLEPDPVSGPRQPEVVVLEPPRGMRAIEIATVTPDPDRPDEPEREPEPEPEPEPEVASVGPTEAAPADSLTAADRLAVRVVDPRLWRPMVLMPREPTIEDVEARLGAAIELLSDSALADAEAALRARDWTVEDADGGRWGISPGLLHLGKLTLPLPIWFPVDLEAEAANRQWYELDQQLERARILESFEARVRAIRERRDRERSERVEGEAGGSGGEDPGS
jgi:hypothetical protein